MNVCTHGQLARSCELCERDAEIARLTRERDEWSGLAAERNREIARLREENEKLRHAYNVELLANRPKGDLVRAIEPSSRRTEAPCIGCSDADPFKCHGKTAYDGVACPCVCHGL